MNFKLKFLLVMAFILPTYTVSAPRVKVQILIPSSSLNSDPSEKLTKILRRQPNNVLYNLRKVVAEDKIQPIEHLINNIDVEEPMPDKLGSIKEHYDFWKTQYLLELIKSTIDKKQNIYTSNTQIFLGELTKKFEGTILQENFFNTNIDVTADHLNSTVNVHTAVFLLALLLDANDRNELPAFKNYLIMALDNTLTDIRKDKKFMDVKEVTEQISQILSGIKNTVTNPLPSSVNKTPKVGK